ncbi:hypothetical protein PISMIDRAFT_676916 [Pisolithus microcarpus 441]|uniref:Uncharacterized protein n=1 Tax=Pisolithus microcarpus 441 TaxID=765257 RepID=A0A0C9Z8K2_9AGAM|nr:hypothetical protein PISMIDRAFT_676916 [Pisolithus microcarpus 441]
MRRLLARPWWKSLKNESFELQHPSHGEPGESICMPWCFKFHLPKSFQKTHRNDFGDRT